MAESESKTVTLPWAPLLALLATIAGLSALLPSRSARPSASETEVLLPNHKAVSARLWQDPLQVVSEAESRRLKDSKDPKDRAPDWTELKTEYDDLDLNLQSPLVLMVCVPDSPYAEDVERRLRDRAAVLQALSAENYVPRHSTVLKYVLSGDCAFPGYALPFEWFGPLDNASLRHQSPGLQRRNVLVLWVGDGYLGDQPLRGLARIAAHLIDNDDPNALPEVRVLGPSTSGQYRKMLEELGQPTGQDFEKAKLLPSRKFLLSHKLILSHEFLLSHNSLLTPRLLLSPEFLLPAESLLSHKCSLSTGFLLSHAKFYSCKATGADPALRDGIKWLDHDPADTAGAVQRSIRALFSGSRFSFSRTTPTDDVFCERLWFELEQRHVSNDAHIAVLSELDSFYGRASVDTFVAKKPDRRSGNVHTYYYMAGIDGALPKNALGTEEKTAKEQSSGSSAPAPQREATEGHCQLDYFRRLADALAQENQRLVAGGKPIDKDGFKAVVVLGSDIYDKLQILRTLRPRLSTALFLTDGLDARFGHPDEWDETRNLIVAAGQPLRLNLRDKSASALASDNSPLPFRDSIQTSVYLAARHALHAKDDDETEQTAAEDYPAGWNGHAQLFEIGKRGPAPLGERVENDPWGYPRWISLIIAIAVLIAILCLVIGRIALPPGTPAPVGFWQRLYLGMSRTYLAGPAALILSGGMTWIRWFRQHDLPAPEPFALFDGISIWPGDFLRLLVFFLAIHFVCKILVELKANTKTLAEDFGLPYPPAVTPPAQKSSSTLQRMAGILQHVWPHPAPFVKGTGVDAQALMARYYGWARPWKRCLRAFSYLALYVILMFAIMGAFPSPNPDLPVRGEAHVLSMWILGFALVAMLFVTFLVVDATTVNCLFIRELNSDRTNWGFSNPTAAGSRFKFLNHLAVLDPNDCADYLDIQYIARRSDVVSRLIYFPFILIALLLLARSSTTDGYTWSSMLIVTFGLNLSWAIYCAIRLPIEARAARSETLRRLRCHLFRLRADEAGNPPPLPKPNSAALDAVITEIENLRQGAFLGIWEQPLLRAFLVPSGGAGLSALLDLLPR